MRKIIVLIFLFSIINTIYSQNKKLEKADLLFEQFNFNKALSKYLQLKKDGISPYHVSLKIADCYRQLQDYYDAEQWYKEVMLFPDYTPEINFYLGQVLIQQGKQNEAVDYLKNYFDQNNSASFKLISKDYLTYLTILEEQHDYNIINIPVNSKYSDFAPTWHQTKLYFSSNRPANTIIKRGDVRTNIAFYNIYESKINDNKFEEPVKADPAFNSRYNDGPICFSDIGDLAFITRNDIVKGPKKSQLDIVISKFRNEQWTKEVDRLSTKDKNYSIAYPFITKDLSRLYYASNMPGGYGGMDIYYSEFSNGFLSAPVNLGPEINTPGNETFPFLTDDRILYFTSDGHPGLGGFDIYYANLSNTDDIIVFNLGAPINTKSDEMGFSFGNDPQTAYFSSNREGGVGSDDIYEVRLNSILQYTKIEGKTMGIDKFPLNGTIVTVFDNDNKTFNEVETNDTGEFKFYVPDNHSYKIVFKRRFYNNKEIVINQSDLNNETSIQLEIILNKN